MVYGTICLIMGIVAASPRLLKRSLTCLIFDHCRVRKAGRDGRVRCRQEFTLARARMQLL